ncbi:hypothetical protein [Pseudohongiella spirulinae]|uniref:Uncharacterized protein n=1 Tax=Pseudohongiella spirulinae TaxID=1249552 RepID=A0A0S2KFN3_9GAMM|nr:hypothetical protein [Pseudohongiella spirulinae]ALO47148.1 hypothetical protein PS2015_2514 [Pseudohongiella spirulinae]
MPSLQLSGRRTGKVFLVEVLGTQWRNSGLPAYQLSGGYRSTGVQLVHRRDIEFELSVALVWRF